ncbi:hypothetical protein Q7P36_010223 [Cladosporium allicinum]
MTKHGTIELQQPLGQADGASGTSDVAKEEVSHHLGNEHDQADMARLGKKQRLDRNFRSLSVLGLTCVLMATWETMLITAGIGMMNGGRAGFTYVYIATWLLTMVTTASMAEMASMAPTAGGQYHWVSEFAPPSIQNVLSYTSGWLAALGWQAFIATTSFGAGYTILISASLTMDYEIKDWHVTLMTIFIALLATVFNTFAARRLPMFEGMILYLHIILWFGFHIPAWVLAPKVSAAEVFGKFENWGGWPTMGGAVVLGQLASSSAFAGVDSAAHMAEEVRDASRTVPRMMMLTTVLNGALGLAAAITMCFITTDIDRQILNGDPNYPYVALLAEALDSVGGAVTIASGVVVIAISMTINAVAASSRQSWAFARDGGLPFSDWFTRIRVIDGAPLPVNSIMASLCICVIIALLNLVGDRVFNSIIGLLTGALGLTYALSIGCVLWRRCFGAPLPPARWSLGRWGIPCNIIALLYSIMSTLISFFPIFYGTGPSDMNWSSAIFALILVLSVVYYFVRGRKIYRGPADLVKKSE